MRTELRKGRTALLDEFRLVAAFLVLAFGYVGCEYRLFGQMLLGEEETIRSSMVNADLTASEILREIVTVWKEGIFHGRGAR